jgi:ribonuclease P protein component
MISRRSTFKRGERLKHRKLIKALFKSSNRKHVFPIQVLYNLNAEIKSTFPAQAAFVIPKKNFKKTTQRNILKRRMKEAYRLNKQTFYSALPDLAKPLSMIFIYTGEERLTYGAIEKAMIKVMDKVVKDCTGHDK